jgi:hypothetical protein
MRPMAVLPLVMVLVGPALAALTEDEKPLALAAVQYGHDHLDPKTGLVRDSTDMPSVAESSIGYAAACFLLGQDLADGRQVLGKILDSQQATGPQAGHFPWTGGADSKPNEEAVLYMAPLLGAIYRQGGEGLDEALRTRLRQGLELAFGAVSRLRLTPADDSRFLLRAAALGAIGAALGTAAGQTAADDVAGWLGLVRAGGLPSGHSPTLDATRLVALKWVLEAAPEPARPPVQQALLLAAADLAERLCPALPGVAGAQGTAPPSDYLGAPGFASYVLYTDFGYPRPASVEPYVMAALAPSWRAPEPIRRLVAQAPPRMVRTQSPGETPVRGTATYLAPGFSLGTLSGEVGPSTIPLFATFAGPVSRPTLYAFCSPTPCHVQTVQDGNLALLSFDFDNIGQGSRRQAWVQVVLGRSEDVDEVYAYGQPWNDLPAPLGERECLAVAMHGCYVGFTLTRVGPAASAEGPAAKPGSLRWGAEGRKGELSLVVRARQADYALPRPLDDVRAGLIVEIAPRAAYESLADFARHLDAGRQKQSVRTYKDRQTNQAESREPGVLVPYPTAGGDRASRTITEQTIEYVNGQRSLKLVEDLLADVTRQTFVDGKEVKPTGLWDGPGFSLAPGADLATALAPFGR